MNAWEKTVENLPEKSQWAIECFLNSMDRVPHAELIVGDKEAFQWAWEHIGLFGVKASESLFNMTPDGKALGLFLQTFENWQQNKNKYLKDFLLLEGLSQTGKVNQSRNSTTKISRKDLLEIEQKIERNLGNIIALFPEKDLLPIAKKLGNIPGYWWQILALKKSLDSELLKLILENGDSLGRQTLAQKLDTYNYRPLSLCLQLAGDSSTFVARRGLIFSTISGPFLDFYPLLAYQVPGDAIWQAFPYKVKDNNNTLDFEYVWKTPLKLPNLLIKKGLLGYSTKQNTGNENYINSEKISPTPIILCGQLQDTYNEFEKYPAFKGKTTAPYPKITAVEASPTKKIIATLGLTLIHGQQIFAFWLDAFNHPLGWTKISKIELSSSLGKTPITKTIERQAWLYHNEILINFEKSFKIFLAKQIVL